MAEGDPAKKQGRKPRVILGGAIPEGRVVKSQTTPQKPPPPPPAKKGPRDGK